MKELGYSMGGYPSSQFCLLEGDVLSLQFEGDITATPVHSERVNYHYITFQIIIGQLYINYSYDRIDDNLFYNSVMVGIGQNQTSVFIH